jgi:hypothetical protein
MAEARLAAGQLVNPLDHPCPFAQATYFQTYRHSRALHLVYLPRVLIDQRAGTSPVSLRIDRDCSPMVPASQFHPIRRAIVHSPNRSNRTAITGLCQNFLARYREILLPPVGIGKVVCRLLGFFFNPALALGNFPFGMRRRQLSREMDVSPYGPQNQSPVYSSAAPGPR